MKLARLLGEIEAAKGPITGIELASRLDVGTAEVHAMLAALRAAGKLAPEGRHVESPDTCSAAGSCSMSCPGPEECSLVVDVYVSGLEIRRPSPTS